MAWKFSVWSLMEIAPEVKGIVGEVIAYQVHSDIGDLADSLAPLVVSAVRDILGDDYEDIEEIVNLEILADGLAQVIEAFEPALQRGRE